MRKHTIRPSKGVSKFSFFIGLGFTAFGIVFIIGAFFTPIAIMTVPFAIIWTSIAIFNTYRAYKNGFTEEGIAIYEIDSISKDNEQGIDFEEKLRKIDRLKREGLISEEEYNKKRAEIMGKEW